MVVSDLAVGYRVADGIVVLAAGADYEPTYTAHEVEIALSVLRCETLVVVVMTREHDVRPGIIKRLPDRPHGWCVAVLARAKERVVPVGQRADCRVCGQVSTQPLLLWGARPTAADPGA